MLRICLIIPYNLDVEIKNVSDFQKTTRPTNKSHLLEKKEVRIGI